MINFSSGMTWRNPLVIIPAVCGLIFILAGIIATRFPAKKINWLYGYRTPLSMRSQEAWDFAQTHSSRLIAQWGAVLVGISLIGTLNFINGFPALAIAVGLLIATKLVMRKTDRAIRKRFGNS